MIKVSLYDMVYFQIDADYHILQQIDKFFSLKMKNAHFNPMVKSGRWDGIIHYFNLKSALLPIGLYKRFFKFCKINKYEIDLAFDTSIINEKVEESSIEKFVNKLFTGQDIDPHDRPYTIDAFRLALNKKRGIVQLFTGCHAKGEKVLLSDGREIEVERVKVGDKLLGLNGEPREVLELKSGREKLYRITPKKGKSFVVNGNHILHLYSKSKDDFVDITVNDWKMLNESDKEDLHLWWNNREIEFEKNENELLLGSDCFVFDGSDIVKMKDTVKCGSIKQRKAALHWICETSFYITKNEKLIDDFIYVAKSLGYEFTKIKRELCYITNEYVYFLKLDWTCKNNTYLFDIDELEIDDYYGFELDGDHLYFDNDFLMHHNSGKSSIIYMIVRFLLMCNKQVLLIVPTTSLVVQMYSDFQDYGWSDCKDWVCKMYSGMTYDETKPVLISTYQSLAKKDKEFFDRFGGMIVDECFNPNTKVKLSNGESKRIEDVEIGDVVKSYNPESGDWQNKKVDKTYRNWSDDLYCVEDENGKIWWPNGVTGNHTIYTISGKKKVCELVEGDEIIEG